MSRERRRHDRIAVDWPARVGGRGLGVLPARIKDATIAGVYVETKLAVDVGAHILLEMQTDNSQRILAEGKIMRSQTLEQSRYGYGIQFTRIEDDALQKLLSLLAEKWKPDSAAT